MSGTWSPRTRGIAISGAIGRAVGRPSIASRTCSGTIGYTQMRGLSAVPGPAAANVSSNGAPSPYTCVRTRVRSLMDVCIQDAARSSQTCVVPLARPCANHASPLLHALLADFSIQSSSLARHRRIHTGNRPYKCNHDGCTKSFCRKTTMVKHLKRSHHPGRHSPEMEDMISDGGSDSPPSTPNSHVAMPLQPSLGFGPITGQPAYPAGYPQQSTPSFAQTAQHAPYALQPQYGHRHSLPHSQPTPDYHGLSQPQQHPPALGQVFQRTASLPHQLQYHPQVPRQGPERPPLNIPPSPYPTGEHDITSSIPQASPGGFSVTSGHGSPAAQQDFYTHLPPGNSAAYTLRPSGPTAHHQPHAISPASTAPMMALQGQLPPLQQQQQQYRQELHRHFSPLRPQDGQRAAQQQYHLQQHQQLQQQLQQQQQQQDNQPDQQRQQQQHEQHQQHQHPQQSWGFDGEVAVVQQYQSPTDVTAIGSLPFSAANNFELWDPDKLDFNETGMTMPSTRINEMS